MSSLGLSLSEPPGAGPAYLTAADILGRGVAVEWYEAVALVRAVAELTAGASRAVPELNQIRLDSTGVVDVIGSASSDEPVRRLGQLLQALIVQADAPVQLRLMITQATSPAPLFASVHEYSEALGYFERPNRTGVLRALYERAAAQPVSESITVPMLDDVAPLPDMKTAGLQKERRKHDPVRTRRILTAAVGIGAIVAIAGAGVWLVKHQRVQTPSRSQVSEIAGRASEKLGDAVVSGASAVADSLGLGRIVAADQATDPPPASPAPAADPPGEKPARKKPAGTVKARSMPGMAFDLAGTARTTGLGGDTIYDAVVTDGDVEGRAADSSILYGPGSDGVIPPVAVEPRLPQKLPPDIDEQQLGKIELVIAVDGSVESVKLVGPPRNVHDAMFLSVAKAWQFQPALKDGLPVRYRKTIWIASQ